MSPEELVAVLGASDDPLTTEEFTAVVTHMTKPEYHDALWVAIDTEQIEASRIERISQFVIENRVEAEKINVSDTKTATVLFFLAAWKMFRQENYHKSHEGVSMALSISASYRPGKILHDLLVNQVEQQRVPPLTLNEKGRVNHIEVNPAEELEINPRWIG